MNVLYAIVNACDELIVTEETDRSNTLLTILFGSVALVNKWTDYTQKVSDET